MFAQRQRRQIEILVTKGLLPLEDCRRAEQLARNAAISFDTAILELSLLGEDELVQALASGFGVSPAFAEDLAKPEAEALARVPLKLMKSSSILPFRLSGTRLMIAMRDFDDYGLLDELAFVTSRRIEPCWAADARLEHALLLVTKAKVTPRLTALIQRLDAKRLALDTSTSAEVPLLAPIDETDGINLGAPAAAPPPATPSAALVAPGAESGTLTEHLGSDPNPDPQPPTPNSSGESASALEPPSAEPATTTSAASPEADSRFPIPDSPFPIPDSDRPPTPDPRTPSPRPSNAEPAPVRDLETLGAHLADVRERDQVATLVADYLAPSFQRVILLMMRGREVAGWFGRGEGLDAASLSSLRIPLSEPSIFLDLREGGTSYSGPLPDLPTHHQLAATWGGDWPQHCAVHPIEIRGRRVAVLYVDGKQSEGESTELADVAAKAGVAFEICILRLKLVGS